MTALPAAANPTHRPSDAEAAEVGEAADAGEADEADEVAKEKDPVPADTADAAGPRRRIRSYVLRGGRLGGGQRRALEELAPRFVLPFAEAPIDARAVFGRSAPLVVEIGFGMGDATARIARALPQVDFLGVEVHLPGVGALLARIGELGLANLRIVRHDAVAVLEKMIAPGSLAGVHLYFPDPWPKKRHHKRRLLQPPFAALVASRLAPGGYLHCATDWEPYAAWMLEVLAAEPLLVNGSAEGGYSPRPDWRPLTKFEARGLNLGHGVRDLVFVRRGEVHGRDEDPSRSEGEAGMTSGWAPPWAA